MANKVDDVHHEVKDVHHEVKDVHHKVEDIHTILKRSEMRPVSDTLTRQEMPLKPKVFHGRDDFVERIAQLSGCLVLKRQQQLSSSKSYAFNCRYLEISR